MKMELITTPSQTSQNIATYLHQTEEQARDYLKKSKAENTIRAYRADWNCFTTWCKENDLSALPATPETVSLYLTGMAGQKKCSTLQRRLSAISQAHQAANHESPTLHIKVRAIWRGIRRTHGTAYEGKAPAITADIKKMVETLDNLKNEKLRVRDRALLLLGFAGAFRRSELVGLDYADLLINSDGITVNLRKSKTDQEGQGRKIGIPYGSNRETCPVRSLQKWLEVSGISFGALFRPINRHNQMRNMRLSDKAVALIVKRCAKSAGLDSTKYAGHSLRAGLATSAANAGVSERAIMNQTGHNSVVMVRRYIREGTIFKDNAAAQVGL